MTTATTPVTLAIDKQHSDVAFQVRHLITKVRGRFTDFEGTIHSSDEDPSLSSVTFSIQAPSIDTGTPDRDTHLRSEDFLHVDRFPTIDFVSSKVEKTGSTEYAVTGALTIRGVTRPITVSVTSLGTGKDPWGNVRAGFEAEATLNRKDFGLLWNATLETGGFLVGDEVKVTLSVQATVQP